MREEPRSYEGQLQPGAVLRQNRYELHPTVIEDLVTEDFVGEKKDQTVTAETNQVVKTETK